MKSFRKLGKILLVVVSFYVLHVFVVNPASASSLPICSQDSDCKELEGLGGCVMKTKQCRNKACQYTFQCTSDCPTSWSAWGTCYDGYQQRYCVSHPAAIQMQACGANTRPPKTPYYGPNCPAGTNIDLGTRTDRFCFPNDKFPWWSPADDAYVMGSAQRSGPCCRMVEEPVVWSDWYPCKSGNGKLCRHVESGGGEYCVKNYTDTFFCKPLHPAIVITNTIKSTGDAMGCVAAAGYVGRGANNTLSVNVSTPTTYANGTVNDMRLWVGSSPYTSETLSTTLPQAIAAQAAQNTNFGILVKKVGNNWTDVYAPTRYNSTSPHTPQPGLQGWTKVGTTSAPVTINGKDGKPMILVTNISVTVSGANTVLTANLSFNHNYSSSPDNNLIRSHGFKLSSSANKFFN